MLDELASFKAEYVYPCPVAVSGPFLSRVKDNKILLSQCANDMNPLSGILRLHSFEVGDEPILAVRHNGVVPNVVGASASLG